MKRWTAFWGIVVKDLRAYYLKPPNISWGLLFPLVWAGMFFIRTGSGLEGVRGLLPGVAGVSVLFGTTSLLSVTVTQEKRNRSFDRLLLAPIPLETLMLAKTCGAICFGVVNAFVPVVMAAFLTDCRDSPLGCFFRPWRFWRFPRRFWGFSSPWPWPRSSRPRPCPTFSASPCFFYAACFSPSPGFRCSCVPCPTSFP